MEIAEVSQFHSKSLSMSEPKTNMRWNKFKLTNICESQIIYQFYKLALLECYQAIQSIKLITNTENVGKVKFSRYDSILS
jgi:hypothetical protein